jgi:hypothetical protein
MKRADADIRRRCFDLVDELRDYPIEHADLRVVQAVAIAEEKIGDASEHIDAFVRRTIAQDCVQIVKEKPVGLGH